MTPSTELDWASNLFIDINDQYRYKKKYLFESFKSQNNKSYFNESVFESFHESYQTKKRGLEKVEFSKFLHSFYNFYKILLLCIYSV